MIKAPYDPNRSYDIMFEKIILGIRDRIKDKDDDFMVMCFGSTGTGKSNLMLHSYELYDTEGCTVDNIGLNPKDFATAINNASKTKGFRYCGNDEANVSKRDHSTKWNKDILDLYFAIRGLRIFHWWNNPSLDMIDKPFIEEKIKGFIFISTKDINKPRVYYYFRKKDLLNLYEKHGNLKINVLKKHCKEYAYYKGWFRKYEGKLLQAYLDKKEVRMEEKVENFYQKYGSGERLSMTEMAKRLGVSRTTVKKFINQLMDDGELSETYHYTINEMGRKTYTTDAYELIKAICNSKITS